MTGRIPITDIRPQVDCGTRPAKAVVGESLQISATIFREGHDAVAANVVLRDPRGRAGAWTPMQLVSPGTDRFTATVTATKVGQWSYTIEAWGDPIATWRHDATIKVRAGMDVELMLETGALLLDRASEYCPDEMAVKVLREAAIGLRDDTHPGPMRLAAALTPEVTGILALHPLREFVTASKRLPLAVDRREAMFSSWYEFFPRSEGATLDPPKSGTFATAAQRLPAVAEMGFDVVYLPPIHPIGNAFRKGPNNTLTPGPDDPGSPWAIGSAEGGHDAIHPDLGTLADFDAFVARAGELGMEVALDFALQASPDHPWVSEHPEWFTTRADGTIAYAENPPKKYQDIYPINFWCADRKRLWEACRDVVLHWVSHGVKTFRVDNPHTKPSAFWEWMIEDVQSAHPDVIFFAEAFTRPKRLKNLAKLGFTMSYTYFTWKNTSRELTEFLGELNTPELTEYLRGNLFVNTP
ncbi:MAG: maltotransferase domain-containing protein, partial [Sporichthyaceae bacterium]